MWDNTTITMLVRYRLREQRDSCNQNNLMESRRGSNGNNSEIKDQQTGHSNE